MQYSRAGSKAGVLSHVIADRLEREFTIEDLEEWTEYEVRVQALNGIGTGPLSRSIIGRTRESGEHPSISLSLAAFKMISATTFLHYSMPLLKSSQQMALHTNPCCLTSHQFNKLLPYFFRLIYISSQYAFYFLQEKKKEFDSGLTHASNPSPTVPSCGPSNVSAFATTSSSILVRWGEVLEHDRNGLILGYKVCIGPFYQLKNLVFSEVFLHVSFLFFKLPLKHYWGTFSFILYVTIIHFPAYPHMSLLLG